MAKQTPNNSKKRKDLKGLKHPAEYQEFIIWMALPEPLRNPKTQRELAKNFGVGEDTLSEWKRRDGFWDEATKRRKEWGRERTPNVILGLYRKAVRDGNAAEVKLWLEYIEGYIGKQAIEHRDDSLTNLLLEISNEKEPAVNEKNTSSQWQDNEGGAGERHKDPEIKIKSVLD